MTPRQRLRELKNAQVKRALYDAAMELFLTKGFDETSVDEITEKAGFSRATFFNHFGSKQGVLRYYGQELQTLVEGLMEGEGSAKDPLDTIREVIYAMVHEVEEHGDEAKIIYTYSMRDPSYIFDQTPARKRVWEILKDLVSRAQELGQIRKDLSSAELSIHILSLYQGVVLATIMGIGTTEPLLHSVWQFILGGVKGGNTSSSKRNAVR